MDDDFDIREERISRLWFAVTAVAYATKRKKSLKISRKLRLLEFQPLSASEPPLDGAEAGQEGRGRLRVKPRRW